MQRRYVTVDVFTDRAFGGNPLAVVLDADDLSTAQMQAVAREFNYSETTFVLPPRDRAHTAQVRIFTPRHEMPFAGHPNVGTALVLATEGLAAGDHLVFEELAGLVAVTLLRAEGQPLEAELTAPLPFSILATLDAEAVGPCVGLAPGDVRVALHPPVIASVGLAFVIAELSDRATLARAAGDGAAFALLLPRDGADAVFLHVADANDAGVRHARMFFPLDGIVEDPATGSAAGALAGLLAHLSAEQTLDLRLVVRQGEDMGRPSLLRASASKTDGRPGAVTVRGGSVTMMRGTFELRGEG